MTYRKITITLVLCCYNLLGFGQVERYSVESTGGLYGIYKDNKQCVVPPIFNHLSNFNSNGLSIAIRIIPFVSITPGKVDTVFWKKYYPDKFIKDTIYLNGYYPDKFLHGYKMWNPNWEITCFTNGKDTQYFEARWMYPEELMLPTSNDYMDSIGNYYLNIFHKLDQYGLNNHTSIKLYGIIDTNGRIVQPLIYQSISFGEEYLRGQKFYTFVNRNKLGFMDTTGKIIISPKYDENIIYRGREYWFYMNESESAEFNSFFDNLCKVALKHKLGIIDINDNVIIPFEYQHIYYEYVNYNYPRKIYRIHTVDFNGNKKVFDKTGKEIKE